MSSTINTRAAYLIGPTFGGHLDSSQGLTLTGTVKYEDLLCTEAD
ncbi:MAG: hypothetical protein A4E48_00834 [Methanosaeta sp. PtaU1.Bin060]|nr:MAG: hypothetical protein A4E48_00834 [Methanosaeta sp. PtaU1.Bin060]